MTISQPTQELSWAFLRLEKNIREEDSTDFAALREDLAHQFTEIVDTDEYIAADCTIGDVQPLVDRIVELNEGDLDGLYAIHRDTSSLADQKGIERKEGWVMNGGGGKSPLTEPTT